VSDAVTGANSDDVGYRPGDKRWLGQLLCGVSALTTLGIVALVSAYLMSSAVDTSTVAEDAESLDKFSTAAGAEEKD